MSAAARITGWSGAAADLAGRVSTRREGCSASVRQHGQRCHRTRSVSPAEVVPNSRCARSVITTVLERREHGWSWERCAEACTSDGLVAASVVRRWHRCFGNGGGPDQRSTPFSTGSEAARPSEPAGIRSFEPQQQQQWARSPPPGEPSLRTGRPGPGQHPGVRRSGRGSAQPPSGSCPQGGMETGAWERMGCEASPPWPPARAGPNHKPHPHPVSSRRRVLSPPAAAAVNGQRPEGGAPQAGVATAPGQDTGAQPCPAPPRDRPGWVSLGRGFHRNAHATAVVPRGDFGPQALGHAPPGVRQTFGPATSSRGRRRPDQGPPAASC